MSKPEITLEPSKGVIAEAAARIYAAYVAAGRVKDDDVEFWVKRSIREAVGIAKAVDGSIESHDALVARESIVVRPTADAPKSDQRTKRSLAKGKKSRKEKEKPRKTKKSKSRDKKQSLEELAEDVLMGDGVQEEATPLELEDGPGKSSAVESSSKSTAKETHESKPKDDSATVAEKALTKMNRGTTSIQSNPEEAF